jgi:flagellar protein FliL
MAAAKKEAKQDPKAKDETASAEGAGNSEAKQKKKKIIMIVGLALLLIIVSVGATFGIMKMLMPKPTAGDTAHETADESADESADEHEHKDEPAEPELPVIYYALKPNFTVNYDVNGRQRFLQLELTIVYREPTILPLLELHMPEVRNGLVMLLSSQNFDELQVAEGKEKLRAAALSSMQSILAKEQKAADKKMEKDKEAEKPKTKGKEKMPNIEQVLFTHFVMQ